MTCSLWQNHYLLHLYEATEYILDKFFNEGRPRVNHEAFGCHHPEYLLHVLRGTITSDFPFHHQKLIWSEWCMDLEPIQGSTGNTEFWTFTSPLSISWWLSIPIIAETTGLVLGGEVLDLNWASVIWLFHSIVGSFGSSPWRELDLLLFLKILGESSYSLLYHVESFNNWLDIFCIISDGRWRIKMIRVVTWIGQCCRSSNHL